jgi:hypothetical protein
MKDGSALPKFVRFFRGSLQIQIDEGKFQGPLPAPPMNEWKMKLVLWDIYGNSANLYFILIIVAHDPNFAACLSDSTVVKKPFALDHTYIIGSLWKHKIHIPRPRT